RIAKNNLANQLGYNVPKDVWEDIPLQLAGQFDSRPYEIELRLAITRALNQRPELGALRKTEQIRQEDIQVARAGHLPSAQIFAGYGSRSSQLSSDLSRPGSGWNAGAQFTWDIFDGIFTSGRLHKAREHYLRSR